jgi:O-succinylbenzoic acid--CoA ligase
LEIFKFHKNFKLQGNSFDSVEELLNFSKLISLEIASFLSDWFDKKDAVEVQTSGSTGVPKVIQLSKKHMINSAKATGNYFELPEKTSALLCMSPNYIAGKMMLVRAITLGWHLDFVEPVSNPLMKIKKKYDFSALVPLQLNNSLNEINTIKKIIVGGGVVSNKLLRNIQNISTDVFATYGMTETITHIAVKKLNHFHSELVEESYYQVVPDIKISTDKRDCLIIYAPSLADEEIITNDVVELISDSEFKWLGRFDTIINSGGIKLIPEQIEKKISAVLSNRFFVAGIPDTILGEKLVLIVEGEELNSIMNEIKNLNSLSKYEIPKEIYFVDNFIETPTRKINRSATLKLIKSTY